ncbi:hypothetical protein CO083_01900 [Candidatus Roizmanbacteria bacterium CG_4_9_14_0_8_um_filter_34_12]|uniref:Phosphatidic acid phosphatase type 2/haloperoxidase domain-containing protein n=2 Tax=Candidatus Roizmaniibacteriota TaxID=1752723 RepID=A0A2M8DDD5_9BACT|nr:MAG: hypothetical protein CO083_01900 [Candidatus Roizmanbacteria bacterium CG_4_9_14_0_8_um_filter_34_12]
MIQLIDTIITIFLRDLIPHNSFFEPVFSFLSLNGFSLAIWVAIIIITTIIEEIHHPGIQKRDKKFIFYFILIFCIQLITVNYVLKPLIHRPRPFQPPRDFIASSTFDHPIIPINTCPADFSFPSGHAATAFTAAFVLSYFDKKRRWFYYLIAVFISFSRIYLGCHYFFDVVFGGLIGSLITWITLKVKYPITKRV